MQLEYVSMGMQGVRAHRRECWMEKEPTGGKSGLGEPSDEIQEVSMGQDMGRMGTDVSDFGQQEVRAHSL